MPGLVVQQHHAGQEAAVVGHAVQRAGRRQGLRQRQCLCHRWTLRIQHCLFGMHALQLPQPQCAETGHRQQRQQPADQARVLAHHDKSAQTRSDRPIHPAPEPHMSDSLKTLLVIAFLIVIVWNLGAGLYYLLVDRGQTKRTVNALTRRIGVSVALIVLVIVSIYMGWIKPHGVGG